MGEELSEFTSVMAKLGPDGTTSLAPVSFSKRLSEQGLEDALVQNPRYLGEELLVLGRQLIDFAEDSKRLDVLAIDKGGEIVLIEAKVDTEYSFTDLQAIGYAGAYADLTTTHFAKTLRRNAKDSGDQRIREGAGLEVDASLDDAKDAIREFLELTSFESWKPSKQVRIKLVAPGFPKRVLHNVKWLGEVYGMPIEAIRCQLFDVEGQLQIYFDRLLPLPGSEDFDLSIRDREESISKENTTKRKPVLALLVNNEIVKGGDRISLIESAFPPIHREHYIPNDLRFSGLIDGDTPGKILWDPTGVGGDLVQKSPASLVAELLSIFTGEELSAFQGTPVAENYIHEPTGKSLRELAFESGLWE